MLQCQNGIRDSLQLQQFDAEVYLKVDWKCWARRIHEFEQEFSPASWRERTVTTRELEASLCSSDLPTWTWPSLGRCLLVEMIDAKQKICPAPPLVVRGLGILKSS
jgi:hypothetical protein